MYKTDDWIYLDEFYLELEGSVPIRSRKIYVDQLISDLTGIVTLGVVGAGTALGIYGSFQNKWDMCIIGLVLWAFYLSCFYSTTYNLRHNSCLEGMLINKSLT